MGRRLLLLVILMMMAGMASPAAPAQAADYDDVVQTTVDAYLRFLPRYYGELMFRGITSAPVPNNTPRAPLGQFGYRDSLITPDIMVVVRPNNDTIYGNGYVELSKEPVIIKVPENPEGRFWSIQIADRWTNVMPGVGSRRGSKPGFYGLLGPDCTTGLPAGVHELRAPENIMMVTFRVGYFSFESAAESEADLQKAAEFLRRLTGVPLSVYLESGVPEQAPPSADMAAPPHSPRSIVAALAENRPLGLLTLMAQAVSLPDCPLSAEEKKLLARFGGYLKQATAEMAASQSDQPTAAAMIQGLKLARELIDARIRQAAPGDNGWVTINAGVWEERYLDRATIAEYAIYANRPSASIYPDCTADAMAQPLNGAYEYVMKFEADQFPPVTEFWSITIYRDDSLTFAENPIDRYSIGNRTPGLKFGEDGSLTIYIQRDSPGKSKESNWLPAPEGEFNFLARYYGPKEAIQSGEYKLPAIYRVQDLQFLAEQGMLPKNW